VHFLHQPQTVRQQHTYITLRPEDRRQVLLVLALAQRRLAALLHVLPGVRRGYCDTMGGRVTTLAAPSEHGVVVVMIEIIQHVVRVTPLQRHRKHRGTPAAAPATFFAAAAWGLMAFSDAFHSNPEAAAAVSRPRPRRRTTSLAPPALSSAAATATASAGLREGEVEDCDGGEVLERGVSMPAHSDLTPAEVVACLVAQCTATAVLLLHEVD
jgi:hypothetical protein